MEQHIKIKEYLDTICNQIRCRNVHDEISVEIENHIIDQKEAYKTQGIEDEIAMAKAIEQMGDPVTVGTELDRTHRPRPEWSIIVLTFLLLCAGIIIRLFTSPQSINGIENYYQQLFYTIVGMGLMVMCYFADFTLIGKYSKVIFFALGILTTLFIVATTTINGKHIYASYLLLLFPTAFAGIVYSMRNRGYLGVLLCGMFFTIPLIISIIVPSITSAMLLVLACLFILTTAILKNLFGVKKLHAMLLVYLPTIAVLLIVLIANESFWVRVKMAFDPSADPMGATYIGSIIQQLLAGAKLIGQGTLSERFGEVSVSQILPSINSDFLLTYIIHRFGWLVFIIVIALLALFIARAFILCAKQKSVLAFLISLSVILTIGIQTFFYVVLNLGVTLFSPLSLPLISQSNSFLLINMCLVGILLSVFRTGYFIKDKPDSKNVKDNSFIRFEEGKLIIDFKIHA